MEQMRLCDVIETLADLKPDTEVRFGFGEASPDCDRVDLRSLLLSAYLQGMSDTLEAQARTKEQP